MSCSSDPITPKYIPQIITVSIVDNEFQPPRITVNKNDTVKWVNTVTRIILPPVVKMEFPTAFGILELFIMAPAIPICLKVWGLSNIFAASIGKTGWLVL
jgi:hypothetical protein